MNEQIQLPFEYAIIDSQSPLFTLHNGLISTGDIIGVFLCTEGDITATIDSQNYTLNKGDMFFYTPSFFVHVIHKSDDFRGIAIRVDYDFILPAINSALSIQEQLLFRENPYLSLSEKQYNDILALMISMETKLEAVNKISFEKLHKTLTQELIISMGRTLLFETLDIFLSNYPITEKSCQSRNDTIVQNFLISIYQNFRKERDVAFYASQQCMTPSYFTSVIKSKTGKPALQWIIDIVITESKQLLQYSTSSIKEISIHFNFPTQSFFGKYFKQYVGVSPKEYREKYRLQQNIKLPYDNVPDIFKQKKS